MSDKLPPARRDPRLRRLAWVATAALVVLLGLGGRPGGATRAWAGPPVRLCYRLVHAYPHDPDAFTQGLAYADGALYEGTGLVGRSSLRRVDLTSGRSERVRDLPPPYFGEGLTVLNGKIYQLTWRSRVGFVYDQATFEPLRTFDLAGEGWGLTHDGQSLILSDGSERLTFLHPETLVRIGQITVRDGGEPVCGLNELEFVEGRVFANVWQTDRIAVIDPGTGRVDAWLDLTGLLREQDRRLAVDVLNGIAYDPDTHRLWVTGKLWPKLFEIEPLPCS